MYYSSSYLYFRATTVHFVRYPAVNNALSQAIINLCSFHPLSPHFCIEPDLSVLSLVRASWRVPKAVICSDVTFFIVSMNSGQAANVSNSITRCNDISNGIEVRRGNPSCLKYLRGIKGKEQKTKESERNGMSGDTVVNSNETKVPGSREALTAHRTCSKSECGMKSR